MDWANLVNWPEEVRCQLEFSEHLSGAGVGLHGGAIMALADAAGGRCAFLIFPKALRDNDDRVQDNFLKVVRSGHVEAVSRPCTRATL